MRITVTNYTGGRGNWGCQATSRNLLSFLRAALPDESVYEFQIVPLPAVHPMDRWVEKNLGNQILKIFSKESPLKRDLDFIAELTFERFGQFFEKVRNSDLVIFQGEGTIGPERHFRGLRLFALPFLAVHLWGIPVISLNQTTYAPTDATKRALRSLLKAFKIVSVREAASYKFASDLGLGNVLLCPDMALRPPDVQSHCGFLVPENRYFCVTGSALPYEHESKKLEILIKSISEKHRLVPVFMASRRTDVDLFRGMDMGLSCHFIDTSDVPEAEDILTVLRSAEFVIGGRYHTAISALSQGTPVVLLPGNTFKSEGIGSMLGIDCPVYGPSEGGRIARRIEHIMENGKLLRKQINEALVNADLIYECFGSFLRRILGDESNQFALTPEEAQLLKPDPREIVVSREFTRCYEKANRDRSLLGFRVQRLFRSSDRPEYLTETILNSFLELP